MLYSRLESQEQAEIKIINNIYINDDDPRFQKYFDRKINAVPGVY